MFDIHEYINAAFSKVREGIDDLYHQLLKNHPAHPGQLCPHCLAMIFLMMLIVIATGVRMCVDGQAQEVLIRQMIALPEQDAILNIRRWRRQYNIPRPDSPNAELWAWEGDSGCEMDD